MRYIFDRALRINRSPRYGHHLMKKFLITLLVLALIPFSPVSASAAGADAPTWAEQTGLPVGFTWGNWLPCRPEYQTTDCIESVDWLKSDGMRVPGVWTPRPNFNFSTFRQIWVTEGNGESAQYFNLGADQAGTFAFEGLVNPCGNNQLTIDARATRSGFQINAQSTCGQFFKSAFEERFEITVRSKFLKGYAGAISSNGKDPGINYSESGTDQLLTIKANFSYIAWNDVLVDGQYANVCEKNELRARSGGWGLWNNITFVKKSGDNWLADHPGDLMTGTNGWNCGGTMTWDAQQNALVMQVGSPHYSPDGSVVEGWFEGAIRGRYITARYGIKPDVAAGVARLEIIYTDGEKKIATITAKYDAASDWLYLRGYGFTYSSPKLLVKFDKQQEVPPTPAPAASAAAPAVKKSITCIKGKVTRKITAINPICPAGFKKR